MIRRHQAIVASLIGVWLEAAAAAAPVVDSMPSDNSALARKVIDRVAEYRPANPNGVLSTQGGVGSPQWGGSPQTGGKNDRGSGHPSTSYRERKGAAGSSGTGERPGSGTAFSGSGGSGTVGKTTH